MSSAGVTASARGFTLIEVLVALTVLSISLVALLGVFGNGLERAGRMRDSTLATAMAQSLLAAAAQGPPPGVGDSAGDFANGFHWRMHVVPYAEGNDGDAWPLGALRVAVEVSWSDGRLERKVALDTLRLAPKETR
jgi:general secretion pathway protein I